MQCSAGSLQSDLLALAQQVGLDAPAHRLAGWSQEAGDPCAWTRVTCQQVNSTQQISLDLGALELQGAPWPPRTERLRLCPAACAALPPHLLRWQA